jgi:hypothetical protein
MPEQLPLTYRELQAKIAELDEEQLDMSACVVSVEGAQYDIFDTFTAEQSPDSTPECEHFRDEMLDMNEPNQPIMSLFVKE